VSAVVRVGLAGYGDVGRIHALCWKSIPFYYPGEPWRVEVVAVATSREETAAAAARDIGTSFWTTDVEELVTQPNVDLVDCVTPDDAHASVSIAALRAGKHVFCEKPLARTVEEAGAMLEAARVSGRVNAVAFPVRFAPAVLRARRFVDDGLLGRPISFRSSLLHSGYVDPARPTSWRLDADRAAGGALFDLGAHNVDLIRFLVGEFASVTSRVETVVPERPVAPGSEETRPVEVDDVSIALAELEGGAVGTLEFSRVATGITEGPLLEVHGTDGAFRLDGLKPNRLEVFDRSRDEGFREILVPERWPRLGFVPLQYEVARAVVDGRPAAITFEDGYRAQVVLESIRTAGQKRSWVDVPGAPS
jgi:predicted dehydrogenase